MIKSKKGLVDKQHLDLLIFFLFTVGASVIVFYLFYLCPVEYSKLITEDNFAEYCTSVSFCIAGIMLLLLSFKQGPSLRRVIWGGIGVAAILIAGEEISWGQRILSLSTPSTIHQYNLQGEITLHNLEIFSYVNQRLHRIASYAILVWSFVSVLLSTRMQRYKDMMLTIGLPILPIKVLPMFLLVVFFFLFHPTAKADEIGEMFLGVAVLMWATDLFLANYWLKDPKRQTVFPVMGVVLLVVILISAGLTSSHRTSSLGWRYNIMASRDYPAFGMYKQAQDLYDYIYENPQYMRPDTRIDHSRMLLHIGKQTEAFELLSRTVEEFELKGSPIGQKSKDLRRQGIVLKLLKKDDQADVKFNYAIESDLLELSQSEEPNKKATVLWSISKTMEAQGDIAEALLRANEARVIATQPTLRSDLDIWVKVLINKKNW